jgi:hypothetical protein
LHSLRERVVPKLGTKVDPELIVHDGVFDELLKEGSALKQRLSSSDKKDSSAAARNTRETRVLYRTSCNFAVIFAAPIRVDRPLNLAGLDEILARVTESAIEQIGDSSTLMRLSNITGDVIL